MNTQKEQNYYSLITLFILFSSFTLFNLLTRTIPSYLFILSALTVLWTGIYILSGRFSRNSLIPIGVVLALQLVLMNTEASLVFYHICLSLIIVSYAFLFRISLADKALLFSFFTAAYLAASILNTDFSTYSILYYGGIQIFILSAGLGVRTWQIELARKESKDLREELAGLKIKSSCEEEDPFMGIFSKAGGMKVLKQTMKWATRYDLPLTVCYMELSSSRDEYVQSVSRRITTRIRESDTLFRLGSSEILLILPDCCTDDASQVMEHIREIILEDMAHNCRRGIQFGIAGFDKSQKISPNELIISANRASA